MPFDNVPKRVDFLPGRAKDAAIKVHKELGPSLLESIYETIHHEGHKGNQSFVPFVVNTPYSAWSCGTAFTA